MSLITQVARSAGLDRNPMRRRIDLVEAWTRVGTMVVLIFVAPILAWLVGRETYRTGVHKETDDRAVRHHTEAVLLQDAKDVADSAGISPTVLVAATWQLRDGNERTGWVPAKVNAKKGTRVPLWINTDGLPTTPPRPHDETVAQTIATTILVPLVAALLAFGTQLATRTVLDRRRLKQWQSGWLRVEPVWSGRDQ